MPTIVDYSGKAVEHDTDVWTHGGASPHLPLLDRVILDLIDRLGYRPEEVTALMRLPLSRVAGTYWKSRASGFRLANRVATMLRGAGFDPRHAVVLELSAVCEYSFVEIGQALGYDRGHASRIASETAAKLRQRSPLAPRADDDPALGASGLQAELITSLPPVDERQAARECRLHYARNEPLSPLDRLLLWKDMLDAGDYPTQAALAAAVGADRSTVRHLLRLLVLPTEWLDRVARGEITLAHLRPLVAIAGDADKLKSAAAAIAERRPTYREWLRIVARFSKPGGRKG